MNEWVLVEVGLAVVMVLVGVALVLYFRKGKEIEHQKMDYRGFFVIGAAIMAVGIALMSAVSTPVLGISFLAVGVVFMTIGLTNRDKEERH
jgi:hypothetical protein